jgi:O-methyltransferase involved in polyketide biosynthesis/GNAT superfamily N-acetyltransferase
MNMEIIDLAPEYETTYCNCLEDWSGEMREAGGYKAAWLERKKTQGLRVKLARNEGGEIVGMIQYAPIEAAPALGKDLYYVYCVWVHGYAEGPGNYQKRGIGTRLLKAAEDDAAGLGAKGLVAWGVRLPVFMRSKWFKKHGYRSADHEGMLELVWKPFSEGAEPPRLARRRKTPEVTDEAVSVLCFRNGWCPAQNLACERMKRAVAEYDGEVSYREIDSDLRENFDEWGIADGIFIDGKPIVTGPPPSFETLRGALQKRVRRRARRGGRRPSAGSRPAADDGLSALSETLFLPLYSLALETRRPDPIMVDDETVALTRKLDEYFKDNPKPVFRRLAGGRLPHALLTSMSLRIRQYDRYVTAFLEGHPDGVVVNLGCGLENRRRRVDNGRMRWFDLDLPEVIALRRRFMPETDRLRFIASSVLDFGWLDALPAEEGTNYLFLAEGLLMYLPPEGVRALVDLLCERFPGAELVAEVAGARSVKLLQGPVGRGKFRRQFGLSADVSYRFGLSDSRELEGWRPDLKFLGHWTYFDEEEPKLGWYRLFASWPLFRWAQWTIRYRLGGPRAAPPS